MGVTTTEGFGRTVHHAQIRVFSHPYALNIPRNYDDIRYDSVSLQRVVRSLGSNSILVWYYLLQRKRILFVGEKAQTVGNSVLASALMVAPLHVPDKDLIPYITLPDIDRLLSMSTYVAGTTNQLLMQREQWNDLAINLVTGEVKQSQRKSSYKLFKSDRLFIDYVTSEMDQRFSEDWINDQFETFTLTFLASFQAGTLSRRRQKLFEAFGKNDMLQSFLASPACMERLEEHIQKKSRKRTTRASLKRLTSSLWRDKRKSGHSGGEDEPGPLGPSTSLTRTPELEVRPPKITRASSSNSSFVTSLQEPKEAQDTSVDGLDGPPSTASKQTLSVSSPAVQRNRSHSLNKSAPQRQSGDTRLLSTAVLNVDTSDSEFCWEGLFDKSEHETESADLGRNVPTRTPTFQWDDHDSSPSLPDRVPSIRFSTSPDRSPSYSRRSRTPDLSHEEGASAEPSDASPLPESSTPPSREVESPSLSPRA